MRGIAGQRLLDYVIGALAGHLPAGAQAVRSRVGATGGLQIWAVPGTVAADEEYGFWEIGTTGASRLEQRGIWLPWGFGSWLPLPRRVRLRVEAVDVLESVVEAVRKLDESWPAPDVVVRARLQGDDVVAWFHGPATRLALPSLRLPRPLFD